MQVVWIQISASLVKQENITHYQVKPLHATCHVEMVKRSIFLVSLVRIVTWASTEQVVCVQHVNLSAQRYSRKAQKFPTVFVWPEHKKQVPRAVLLVWQARSKRLLALVLVSLVRRVFLAPGLPLARSVQLGNTKQVPRAALLVRRARSRPWPATRRARPASTESPWREPLHARSVARANSGRAPARARRVRPAPGRRPGR